MGLAMTLSEAMHATCASCGGEAQKHRQTQGGVLYCLVLKPKDQDRVNYHASSQHWGISQEEKAKIVGRCPVGWLRKSSLPREVGQVIKAGLGEFV